MPKANAVIIIQSNSHSYAFIMRGALSTLPNTSSWRGTLSTG